MPNRITIDLIRRKAEHNEGLIHTLEELSLHQVSQSSAAAKAVKERGEGGSSRHAAGGIVAGHHVTTLLTAPRPQLRSSYGTPSDKMRVFLCGRNALDMDKPAVGLRNHRSNLAGDNSRKLQMGRILTDG